MTHEVREPDHSATLWRLGMTKGALVAVAILYAAVFVVVIRLQMTTAESHRAADQAKQAATRANFVASQAGHLSFINSQLLKQGQQAKIALCAQQRALRKSVRLSVQFLVDVSTGKRDLPAGVTKDDVLVQIKRNQDLLASFDGLKCPG